jgi:hypothetical protein
MTLLMTCNICTNPCQTSLYCTLIAYCDKTLTLCSYQCIQAAQNQIYFHNTGPHQVPGVVVMELISAAEDNPANPSLIDGTDVVSVRDPLYERIIVVFNAAPTEQVGSHLLLKEVTSNAALS